MLVGKYLLKQRQIVKDKPDIIFLRAKCMGVNNTRFDPSIYPATMTLSQNIKYEMIMTRATDCISDRIDRNVQTTYDIVYERQTPINDD